MKLFKRFGAALLAVLTLAAMLAAPALAAEPEDGIAIQLDGKDLAFTDAVPEGAGEDIFLPFRAVLEAMGAEVDYDAATTTVSAVLGGVELAMIPGQTAITVTENGQSRTVEMSAAPYIKADNGRTYIPIDCVYHAFGYCVGWDEDDRTVILADADALLGDATFTLLDKLAAYAASQEISGNMSIQGALDLTMSGGELAEPVHIGGSLEGVIGKDGAQLTAKVDGADLLYAILAPMMDDSENTAQIREALASLSAMMTAEARADLKSEMLYVSLPPILGLFGGDEEDSGWRSMDIGPYKEQLAGLAELTQIFEMKNLGIGDLLKIVMQSLPMSDKDESYAMLTQVAKIYVDLFSDQAFTKDGGAYTAAAKLGDAADMKITLKEEGEDITGMNADISFVDAASGTVMTMTIESAPGAAGIRMKASATDEESGLETEVEISIACALTDEAPVTTLPEGVEARPFGNK